MIIFFSALVLVINCTLDASPVEFLFKAKIQGRIESFVNISQGVILIIDCKNVLFIAVRDHSKFTGSLSTRLI